MRVFTQLLNKKRNKTDLDFYFENLEEAYGNLPVPSDDWAEVGQLLKKKKNNNVIGGGGCLF
jgi:hypothetical protein